MPLAGIWSCGPGAVLTPGEGDGVLTDLRRTSGDFATVSLSLVLNAHDVFEFLAKQVADGPRFYN